MSEFDSERAYNQLSERLLDHDRQIEDLLTETSTQSALIGQSVGRLEWIDGQRKTIVSQSKSLRYLEHRISLNDRDILIILVCILLIDAAIYLLIKRVQELESWRMNLLPQ